MKKKKIKSWLLIGIIGIVLIITSIVYSILNNNYSNVEKLYWDNVYKDIELEYVYSSMIEIKATAIDKDKKEIKDIKYSVSDGKVEVDKNVAKWYLPKKNGSYTITASISKKKITKTFEVVYFEDSIIYDKNEDVTLDSDNDGLTDVIEKQKGTNIYSIDTDGDGLSDKYEIEISKTDPLKKDTDGDLLNDGDELEFGFDPLVKDSKKDGVNDGDRKLSYDLKNDNFGVDIKIEGTGSISSSSINVIKNTSLASDDGLLDTVYDFYTAGKIDNATVTIKYDVNEVNKNNLDENNLSLYYFDEKTKTLKEVSTVVDAINKTLTVNLSHFSKYVIGDKGKVYSGLNTQVLFIIDNSTSMYSAEQLESAGYDSTKFGTSENDVDYKRISLANSMIEKLSGNFEFGAAEFSGDYVNKIKFNSDKSKVQNTISSIKANFKSNIYGGTNIVGALTKGISEFSNDGKRHYIILVTDGKNTVGNLVSSTNNIIEQAKKNNVRVCIVGIGDSSDKKSLTSIAESTGCSYYNMSSAKLLDLIYDDIQTKIDFNLTDTNGDKSTDGMIVADSGFFVTRDGFNFSNFTSNKGTNGHCYGMATFAMLYYKNQLPLKLNGVDNSKGKYDYNSERGYDLRGTYFGLSKKSSLYEYEFNDEILKMLLYNDFPSDFYNRVEDSVLMINEKYYDKIVKRGFSINNVKIKDSANRFTSYQQINLNIDNETFEKNSYTKDAQLIEAIWRLFVLQSKADNILFDTNPDEAFNKLVSDLNNGTPTILIMEGSFGKHAVNAVKLIQDSSDSNKFKIEIYDNNYSGVRRYIDVTRSEHKAGFLSFELTKKQYDYSFSYGENIKLIVSSPIVK